MDKLEAVAVTFLALYLASEIAFLAWMRIFRGLYQERTQELRRSNDIKIRHFELKNDQSTRLSVARPSDQLRTPTPEQIGVISGKLRMGKGVDALIPKGNS